MERTVIAKETEIKKADIVFIGGGPSSLTFLSFIFQKNLNSLLANTNILIIEKGSSFGSGCLGKYQINSNTSANGFPKLICYPSGKTKKSFEVDLADKSTSKFIPLFTPVQNSQAVQSLLSLGQKSAPLSLVGNFLDHLGNFLIENIQKFYNKNILMKNAEVKLVKIYSNNEFGILTKQNDTEVIIKTKNLILASGGRQSIRQKFFRRIVNLKGEGNVYLSDLFLQQEGLDLFKLKEYKSKIVIIGGSHSGFSCAWLLLKETNLDIIIQYRGNIRVFYPNEESAKMDGYDYNSKEAVNKYGHVYPFNGIRGDAKTLWKRIVRGEEPRVTLVKSDGLDHVKEADAVIWACGYVTNSIPFFDIKGNLVNFVLDDTGMIEVDKELKLMKRNFNSQVTTFPNLFGIGQGYATKSPEIINGKKARADSVHLYNTHIAKKLYKVLRPTIARLSYKIELPILMTRTMVRASTIKENEEKTHSLMKLKTFHKRIKELNEVKLRKNK